ncbi:MAG: endonuclease domain-containing protein [SAR202 cluster bacterium]|nr:endonuclease domain-containing protein [SAR202 cluster bacterium]
MSKTARARASRRNPTDAERVLWQYLRRLQVAGHRFLRQHPLGRYIVDFVCLESRLTVELDGGLHSLRITSDAQREAWLQAEGYRVLRIWNNEVFENIEGVEMAIRMALEETEGSD